MLSTTSRWVRRKKASSDTRSVDERRRISQQDEQPEWQVESDNFTPEQVDHETAADVEAIDVLLASTRTEDLFVEVGDRVTYCFADEPGNRHDVLIVDSASNAKMGIVNEQTPLAQSLLGLSPGDVGELRIAGYKERNLRLLKIQRRENVQT